MITRVTMSASRPDLRVTPTLTMLPTKDYRRLTKMNIQNGLEMTAATCAETRGLRLVASDCPGPITPGLLLSLNICTSRPCAEMRAHAAGQGASAAGMTGPYRAQVA
jgi:hypothetical protein